MRWHSAFFFDWSTTVSVADFSGSGLRRYERSSVSVAKLSGASEDACAPVEGLVRLRSPFFLEVVWIHSEVQI